MTEPPLKMVFHDQFYTGAVDDLVAGPRRPVLRSTAKRLAFQAVVSGRVVAQLLRGSRVVPGHHSLSSSAWIIASPDGLVTAHSGRGEGSPWHLADVIVPGSSGAVQAPVLIGYYRQREEAYRELVEQYEAGLRALRSRHVEASAEGITYGHLTVHPDPDFLAFLKAAIADRTTQLVFSDWLEEHSFPHAVELRSKRWNQGLWTANQLLDLLSKSFTSARRSFSGRSD